MNLTTGQKNVMEHYMKGDNVLALWGRRTGKTTLAKQIIRELDEQVTLVVPNVVMAKRYREFQRIQVLTPERVSLLGVVIKNRHVIIDEHYSLLPPAIVQQFKHVLVLTTPLPETKFTYYEIVPMDFVSRQISPVELLDEFRDIVTDIHFRREFLALLDGEKNIWESEENIS